MNHLFLGMLFIFLDCHVNFGNCTIELLPDFVGYLFLIKGLDALSGENQWFAKKRPWVLGMAVFAGAVYGMDLFALSGKLRMLRWCMGLAAAAGNLVICYWIIAGIRQLEDCRGVELQGKRLRSLWTYLAIISGISAVCGWIPMVGTISAAAEFVVSLCFVIAFYQTKNLYKK